MSEKENPADRQSMILEQLMRSKPDLTEGLNNRFHDKFSAALCDTFETEFKDRVYHGAQIATIKTDRITVHDWAKATDGSANITLFLGDDGTITCALRSPGQIIELLSRIYLGADLNFEAKPRDTPATKGELRLLELFGNCLARALMTHIEATPSTIIALNAEDFAADDHADHESVSCTLALLIGEARHEFELLVPDNLLPKTINTSASKQSPGSNERRNDLKQTEMTASIRVSAGNLTLEQISGLKIGDRLSLPGCGRLPGALMVKDQAIYTGDVGRSGGAYSFMVGDVTCLPQMENETAAF